ncbi:adenosylcobinamide-phosphate synthase CbiB [bacterium]|nr:adenosylcobinamide-phosphate synthase CbiB [bacterium]MBU4561004.1 adenosylcobinamide-phosphate synthase CbiB [bacterium]MCG2675824.1 adenosylcobinamide-phosphate synthase CbiB [bacterium]MCG2677205.1 adenosylcobinamide-phosphate synthase CbiB [bacterium]
MELAYICIIAYIMDLTLGDPKWLGYPVVWIGKIIAFLEAKLRKKIVYYKKSKTPNSPSGTSSPLGTRGELPGLAPRSGAGRTPNYEKIAGIILTVIVAGGSFLFAWTVIRIAYKLYPALGLIVTIWGAFATLSIRGLGQGGERVYLALENQSNQSTGRRTDGQTDRRTGLKLARKRLSEIVGRNTKNLREEGIIRGTVESISENTIDGVVAPLFYLFLGGVPLALAYKAINTLDSMIGYQNRRYKDFGWAGAKLDDIANYIPARIGGVLISLGAFFFKKDGKNAFRIMLRDGRKYHSPNAGLPQGAMAGALGIRLGGINYYRGKKIIKPYLGHPKKKLSSIHIKESSNLMYLTSFLTLILGLLIRWLIIKFLIPAIS